MGGSQMGGKGREGGREGGGVTPREREGREMEGEGGREREGGWVGEWEWGARGKREGGWEEEG